MAALAAKAMGAAPVKEKQALLETRRQQAKKSKSILVGSSSRSVTSEQAGESRSLDVECITLVDGNTKDEGILKRPDGAMEKCVGRLALQASSSIGGTAGDASAEREFGIDCYEASQSKFCIRQYTEIVRQDRGDLKRSWPLAEEYLRGHIFQGRVQVSLWPPIGARESALSQVYRSSFYTPDVPLPHLFKLEIAFAESGVSEDKPEQSWRTAEEVGLEKRVGSLVSSSSDLVERRPSEEGITRPKSSKAGRKISSTTDCPGDGEAQERPKKQDRLLRDSEAKHEEQVAAVQTGSQRTASRADAKEVCVVDRGVKHVRGDDTTIQVKDTGSPRTEPGVSVEASKGKRFVDATYLHVFQEKKTVDKLSKAQVLAGNEAEIVESLGKGKGVANSGGEVEGGPSSIRTRTNVGDSDSNPKRGEGKIAEGLALEKETVVPKRRNEDDRIIEERSTKSDGASAPRLSTKRQRNKACPVCRSFSSMSQTTMNVHIDSCLVEHRQEERVTDADSVEAEAEAEPEPSREPPSRSKPLKSKGPGAKPKRKKRSIADIVANSVTRTLEESPGKEAVRFIGPYSRSTDQVHDSKNLNWVSGNKKKRQPRNVPSRNLKEENESKRRRISRAESAAEESKPARQEKRRLPDKEREETTKTKQLRVERSTGPSTSITNSSKVQNGVEAESRRSGASKTGVATPTSQLPSTRSGPGKGPVIHSNKESNQRDVPESAGLSQSRERRTSVQEDLPMELDEIPEQNLDITSPRKSPTSSQKYPAPASAKNRAAKAHLNASTAGRLASPLPSTDRAPKAPWYPPAAMLRSGTIPPVVVTEPAGNTPVPEITSGTTKSPGSPLTAENLADISRTRLTADTSVSTRKSPRSTTVNSNKGQKGSRSLEGESLLTIDATGEAKTFTGDPSHRTSAQVDVQNMVECRISKEVDDYSDQTETAVEGMAKMTNHSLNFRGGFRAVSVQSPHQPSSIEAKTDLILEKGVANEVVGTIDGIFLSEKQPAGDEGRRRDERRVSVIAEESVTVITTEVDVGKLDQDPSTRAGNKVNVGAEKTSEPAVSRMRKRGGSKAKSRILSEKTKRKGRRASDGNAGQVEETNVILSLPNTDVSEETSIEENQDKLKQEYERKEKKRQVVGTALEPTFKCNSDSVQPAFQNMVVRRIEGVMGQEKVAEQMSLKVVGQEKGVDLVTSSSNNEASPSADQEKGKEEQSSSAQVQASLTDERQLQRPEENLNNMAQLRFGRDTEVSTSSSQTKDVTSQVEDAGANAQVAVEDVVQSHSAQTWSLVPQRPVGRKKLPIKCAARNIGSANAVASAAIQASGNNIASNQGAKSVESPGTEGPEKGSSTGDIGPANNTLSLVTVPKAPLSRSRAARQLAKSLPGGKRGAPHGGVVSPEGQPLSSGSSVADPNAKESSDHVGSTPITPGQQAMLSPSSSWVTNPVRGQLSMSTRPERASAEIFTPKNGTSEPTPEQNRKSEVVADDGVPVSVEKGSGAQQIPLADELHCTETLFGSQSNAELNIHVRTCKGATTDEGSSNAEVPKDTESGTNVEEKYSGELDASVSRLPISQTLESGFSARRSPDQSGLRKTDPASSVQKLNDKDSRESGSACNPENSLSTVFGPTVGGSQRSGRSGSSPGKVVEATVHGKTDTPGPFQTLEAGLATFTSGLGNTNLHLGVVISKVASTSTSMNTQLAQGCQISSNSAVESTRVSYRLKATTTDVSSCQVANVRPVMTTTALLPTSFTSLLQATTLLPQSSAALSLAMQGTRPLQEACADRNELSRAEVGVSTRAVTDPPRRSMDGLTWGSEKHAPSGNDVSMSSYVPAGIAFFRPPPEMGGPSKRSEAGDKGVSRLPSWMRAAISDPKGSEPGPLLTAEAEHTLTEAVKGLIGSPEGGEMSGPVRVRLWGRDVVVPPNEKSNPPTQQGAYGNRREAQREAATGNETVASCRTSTACLDVVTVNSQAGLKVNLGPTPPRVGQVVAESSHEITVPVMNNASSETGVVVSTEAVSVFGKSKNHQAENYLSRLDYNNQRPPYTANTREDVRSSRANKGQTSAAQSTTPPEVIVIDDSAESPAKSGDGFSGEGLTMAFLLDCGALRYLPATQNGRSGSQLMEVDPSKIPQRLVNHNFNILAELRKIGLVPAPKAVLPASYRHSHSLSLEVPHSTPPASRAGSDVLPPWLLAEKKRKEAQIAENLIVLDDDDEPPTGTVILGDRRSLNSGVSAGGSSNLSEQPHSRGQVTSTFAKSGSETRVIEHSTGVLRTSSLSLGATAIPAPGRQSTATSHVGVHLRRGTSLSPHGNELTAAQKGISRKNEHIVGDLVRPAVDKEHLNANTASDSSFREKSGLQNPAANKEQPGGVQTASVSSPTPLRRQREDNRTDKEKQLQVSVLQNEKKTPKGLPAAVGAGQGGPLLKKGSGQGISILASTWMPGNNGWPKRGAAAQACKQAVERLKAQILSSPARDGTSQAGPGGLLDFESHMSGQAQEKSTNFGGNLSSAASCQDGFRYSSLSSRSGGDHEDICGSKEAPHSGRGVGQSPTPGTFTSVVVAAERDVSAVSKSPCVPSVAVHSTAGVQGGAQGMEANQSRSSNPGSKTSEQCNMSNVVVQSTPVREPSTSEQLSPTRSHLGRSSSSSPTFKSRAVVATKVVNETGSAILARGAMQSDQGSLFPVQGTSFSRLPPSRLSLPLHGTSVSTSSTKALLEQVCFTTKAAADSFTGEVTNLQATLEQPAGRMTSLQKGIQPSRLKDIAPVHAGEKTTSNLVSGVPSALTSATTITSISIAQSRPAPGIPSSCSPSISTTDQRRQLESGVIGVVNMSDGTPVVGGLNASGTGSSRSPTSDLPLSSVFGRLSQTSNSSPSSSQGRYTASCAAINPCEEGTWTLSGQTDAGDQPSATGLSDHSPGSGIISGYRLVPQIARAMVGHTQRPRATNPSTPINGGFFASVERSSKQKESDSLPRSRDSGCIAISVHERYSHTRSTREEKMKDSQRELSAEKIRTKSLNSI